MINNIINQTPDNNQETVVTNTGVTGNFLKADAPHQSSTKMVPPIHVGCPNGQTMQSSNPYLFYLTDLPNEDCEVLILLILAHISLV